MGLGHDAKGHVAERNRQLGVFEELEQPLAQDQDLVGVGEQVVVLHAIHILGQLEGRVELVVQLVGEEAKSFCSIT